MCPEILGDGGFVRIKEGESVTGKTSGPNLQQVDRTLKGPLTVKTYHVEGDLDTVIIQAPPKLGGDKVRIPRKLYDKWPRVK